MKKMKHLILLALLAVIAAGSTGCKTRFGRWYAESDYTPDSLGYESYIDNRTGKFDQHGIGLNWNLKPYRGEK